MRPTVKDVSLVAVAAVLTFSIFTPTAVHAQSFCQPGENPSFQFGFAALKAMLGPTMGDPIECAHPNAENGDVIQNTSTGLSFWRKATNTPTFTDGFQHWGLTPGGFVSWSGSSIDPPGVVVPSLASPISPPVVTPPQSEPLSIQQPPAGQGPPPAPVNPPPAVTTAPAVTAGDKNCSDFPSQAAAQAELRARPSDPYGLDRDKDGIACESNRAPKDLVKVPR